MSGEHLLTPPGGNHGLEDARALMANDPDLVDVAGAIYLATHEPFIPVVILVAELDAPVWREYLAPHKGVTVVATALLTPGRAAVRRG